MARSKSFWYYLLFFFADLTHTTQQLLESP